MTETLTELDRIHRELMQLARETKRNSELHKRVLQLIRRVRAAYRSASNE
jgi:hypothetical protein